jgi:cation:H+ antiporter
VIATGWLLLGLVLLVGGAELIVRGGSRVAAHMGVRPIVIGLTIVSVGTSTPELAVGIEAASRGAGALAVGNIAGTNTVNILLILGLSALLRPLALPRLTLRFDLSVMAVSAVTLLLMSLDGVLTRIEGAILLMAALAYTGSIIAWSQQESRRVRAEYRSEFGVSRRGPGFGEVTYAALMLLGGIAVVVLGSDWLVAGAIDLARALDVSDAFIGLTIVAIGTSSPELVTTVIGTLRNDRDIAIGNLLGSSIYNILAILGITCLVPAGGINVGPNLIHIDIPVMTAVALVSIPVFVSGRRVTRAEGLFFVTAYVVYLGYLLLTRL